jgi:putative membrane protein
MKKCLLHCLAITAVLSASAAAQNRQNTSPTDQPKNIPAGQSNNTGHHDKSGKGPATTQGTSGGTHLAAADRKFLIDAAGDSMAEIELGRLAQERATSPDVKSFGSRMVDDHTKASEQLKSLASAKAVKLPEEVPAKHKTHINRLSSLSGAEFDRAYARHMVMDHQKAVAMFQKASNGAKSEEVKQFAATNLPTLKEHLQMAQDLNRKAGDTSGLRSDQDSASRQKGRSSSTDGQGEVRKSNKGSNAAGRDTTPKNP